MRIKRNKSFRKSMTFYQNAFKFREPYRILVDGTFIMEAMKQKIQIREQLPKLLGSQRCTPMVTSCLLAELRSLGAHFTGAIKIAKGYYRLKCEHDPCLSAAECLKSQIGESNDKHYVICTQDKKLIEHSRSVPGVPLVCLHRQVPYLEHPSEASKKKWSQDEAAKMQPKEWEKKTLSELNAKENSDVVEKKKRKKKGVNPLSCLKKKVTKKCESKKADKPKKVRSRRVKVAEAV